MPTFYCDIKNCQRPAYPIDEKGICKFHQRRISDLPVAKLSSANDFPVSTWSVLYNSLRSGHDAFIADIGNTLDKMQNDIISFKEHIRILNVGYGKIFEFLDANLDTEKICSHGMLNIVDVPTVSVTDKLNELRAECMEIAKSHLSSIPASIQRPENKLPKLLKPDTSDIENKKSKKPPHNKKAGMNVPHIDDFDDLDIFLNKDTTIQNMPNSPKKKKPAKKKKQSVYDRLSK